MTYKAIRWPLIIGVVIILVVINNFGLVGEANDTFTSYTIKYDSTYQQFAGTQLKKINDSLPYYLYKQRQEWAENINKAKELVYSGKYHSATSFFSLGVYSMSDNNWYEDEEMAKIEKLFSQYDSMAIDIVKYNNSHTIDKIKTLSDKISNSIFSIQSKKIEENQKEKKGYFAIPVQFILHHGIEEFFIQNGKNKIAYYDTAFSQDSVSKKIRTLAVREIPVRLIKEDNLVLVPINKKYFSWFENIFYFISIACGCFLLSFIIVMPIKILINISKGNAFNPENSKIFFLIAKVILAVDIILLLIKIVTFYSFNHLIPKEIIRFSLMNMVTDNFLFILFPIVAFILGKAFKKGQTIQEENKLTI